jgi:uncharacterized damage-inducible protein DinB
MTTATTMYDFHAWANQTLINRLKELPAAIYTQPITSIFPTLSQAFAHIYIVDYTWYHILTGTNMAEAMAMGRQVQAQAEAASIEELEDLQHQLTARYRTFIQEQHDLERTITLDNPYAGIRDTTISEMIMQVMNHGTYHRGNISAMLRQMGHPSTMTEYALYWYQSDSR